MIFPYITAAATAALSMREVRTVTVYPSTRDEYDTLYADLIAMSDGDTDTAEHDGDGMATNLAARRGWTEIWSADGWRVDIVHPPAE